MVDPVASAFIGRSYHAYEGLVEALDGAHGLVMLGGGRAEVDSRCAHDGVAQLAGKVRAVVSDNAARRAVATDDVLHEQVEHLLGSWVFVDRDGFDPSGQRVDEDHELGGTCALFFVVVMRFSHGQDIGVQDVKRVVADRRTDGVTETAAGLGQGALVALRHVLGGGLAEAGPVVAGSHKGCHAGGRRVPEVIMISREQRVADRIRNKGNRDGGRETAV